MARQHNDHLFPNCPADSISSISINGSSGTPANCLIATAWDNTVSCYEVKYNAFGGANASRQSQMNHDAPVLCSDFAPDGLTVFTGSADGVIKLWNVTQGPTSVQNIGHHDKAVKNIRFNKEKNLLVTTSWDNTFRLWDGRQSTPVRTFDLGSAAYAMDTKNDYIVVGTADRKIHVCSINSNSRLAHYYSPLPYDTRSIRMFHDDQGFTVSSCDGRVGIEHFAEMHAKDSYGKNTIRNGKNFSFRCHRDPVQGESNTFTTYPVHCVDFRPNGEFATGGGDGSICLWNKETRNRVSNLTHFKNTNAVVDLKYDKTGSLLFYAMSYDWAKGHSAANTTSKIYCHVLE